jgi:hypothetical protein
MTWQLVDCFLFEKVFLCANDGDSGYSLIGQLNLKEHLKEVLLTPGEFS